MAWAYLGSIAAGAVTWKAMSLGVWPAFALWLAGGLGPGMWLQEFAEKRLEELRASRPPS